MPWSPSLGTLRPLPHIAKITFHRPIARSTVLFALAAFLALATHPAALLAASGLHRGLGRDGLWHVIAFICVPAARIGIPFPCASVHFDGNGEPDWAVLPVAGNHILTVPTKQMAGIESPAAQATEGAHYWQAAWDARKLIEASHGRELPRSRYGLAINSAFGRSQDQLHIHTGCVSPPVEAALAKEKGRIGQQWTRLLTPIDGAHYMVLRLDRPDLVGQNIVDLLPAAVKANTADMARQTLVVVGATFDDGTDGYYILNTQANRANRGLGEALLDFECR